MSMRVFGFAHDVVVADVGDCVRRSGSGRSFGQMCPGVLRSDLMTTSCRAIERGVLLDALFRRIDGHIVGTLFTHPHTTAWR